MELYLKWRLIFTQKGKKPAVAKEKAVASETLRIRVNRVPIAAKLALRRGSMSWIGPIMGANATTSASSFSRTQEQRPATGSSVYRANAGQA
jgi:hypothetical protein